MLNPVPLTKSYSRIIYKQYEEVKNIPSHSGRFQHRKSTKRKSISKTSDYNINIDIFTFPVAGGDFDETLHEILVRFSFRN